MLKLFAHEGEAHTDTATGILSWLQHRPTWQTLGLIIVFLAVVYSMTMLLKWKLTARLLALATTSIIVGVLYLPHNATVTAIVLSAGFIATFLLVFTMLSKES